MVLLITKDWGVTAPDDIRRGLFNDSGEMASFFGVNLMGNLSVRPLSRRQSVHQDL